VYVYVFVEEVKGRKQSGEVIAPNRQKKKKTGRENCRAAEVFSQPMWECNT
jgi:hypothetical protein